VVLENLSQLVEDGDVDLAGNEFGADGDQGGGEGGHRRKRDQRDRPGGPENSQQVQLSSTSLGSSQRLVES
jgi:hypothetical protein